MLENLTLSGAGYCIFYSEKAAFIFRCKFSLILLYCETDTDSAETLKSRSAALSKTDSYKNIKNAHIYKNVVGETI